VTRLRTVSCQDPGWTRRRRGRGFEYLDEDGRPLDPEQVERVRALVIPPAWQEVWICPDERGHLQAVGVDDASRKQYLYHAEWRRKQDAAKFDRVVDMARQLPGVRRRLDEVLAPGGSGHEQVLAAAVRLIDLGLFRVGSDSYTEEYGSFGLTTLQRRHVHLDGASGGRAHVFAFEGKAGVEQRIRVTDPRLDPVLEAITRKRRPDSKFLSWKDGKRWVPLGAEEINDYLDELFDGRGLTGSTETVTSKDFRTWHGTVIVAVSLAEVDRAQSRTARKRQVNAALDAAAEELGNTRAVAKASYVHPRVVDLFEDGATIERALKRAPSNPRKLQDHLDRAVVRLLS
jgi:DNA topoisomerase IB